MKFRMKNKLCKMLSFKEQKLEKEFLNLRVGHQIYLVNFMTNIWALVFLIGWLLNPFKLPLFQGIPLLMRAMSIGGLMLTRWIVKICPKHIEIIITVIVASVSIIYMESTLTNHFFWNSTMFLLAGLILQMNLFMLMMAKVSAKFSLPVIFFVMFWCLFRYIGMHDNKLMNAMAIFVCMTNSVLLCSLIVITEVGDRKRFSEIKKYEGSLIIFKNLIKEVLPCSVIIANRGEILFSNKETSKLFNLTSDTEIYHETRKIIVEEKKRKSCNNQFLVSEATPFDLLLESESSPKSLYDLIQNTNLTTMGSIGQFINYYGYYQKNNPPYKAIDKAFSEATSLEVQFGKIMWEMKPAMIIILNEDLMIKKMKLLDEQAKYKDKLLATVSHDLRTPLNGVIGMLEIVLDQIGDKFIRKSLVIAHRSSKMLLFMINDILDISQISNGKLRLNFIQFDVSEVVSEVSKLIKFQAKKKGLKFIFENLNEGSKHIVNDPNRLRQVLLNLLGNALKFTHEGFIKITVQPWVKDSKSGYLISVEDTGLGIKEEDKARLFKFFGKLENSGSSNHSGVGLGLVISQSLVKMMNRKEEEEYGIKVVSQEGIGSQFSFFLVSNQKDASVNSPAISSIDNIIFPDEIENEELPQTILEYEKTMPSFHEKSLIQLSILIVDDDQINILVASNYLNSLATHSYEVAVNGAEAVKKVEEAAKRGKPFDLILMDCQMPVMDGFTASEKIVKAMEKGKIPKLTIIATTASSLASDTKKCLQAGMEEILIKPYTKFELVKKLDAVKEKIFKRKKD